MADLNTGSNIIRSEAAAHDAEAASHNLPGAFPETPGVSSTAPKDFIGSSNVAASSSAVSSQPAPSREFDMGTSTVASSTGLQHRVPKNVDMNPASRPLAAAETSVPIKSSPANLENKVSREAEAEAEAETVKPAELAQEIGQGAATAAVAGGIAAKDAAVWTKDKTVENYPAARDTVVENATWAKDRAVENYPAVRDQTVETATAAGNIAYAGAATAASSIANTAQAAYNAAAGALTTETEPTTLPPASSVPETVKDSIATAGEAPEAAANAGAVRDKRALESELLAIAGSGTDKDTKSTANRATEPSVAPSAKPSALDGSSSFAGHMPNRTESTDFVKILGTETYKPHGSSGSSGSGVAAQTTSPAHGGGPAAAQNSGRVAGSTAGGAAALAGAAATGAVLGQHGMAKDIPDTSYTYGQGTSKHNNPYSSSDVGVGGQSKGVVGGMPRSMQSRSEGDHIAPPTGTAAQAPGHGPVEGKLPTYSQAQMEGQAPSKVTVGDNSVKEVEYNKLASGTQSGVASTRYQ